MSKEKLAWILLITLSLVWGSSFILMEKSMFPVDGEKVLGPFQVGSLRIAIAGLVLLSPALKQIRLLNRKNVFWLFIVGMCGNLIPAMLFTLAETRIEPSMAGVLNMGTSFFVLLIGIIFYKSRPSKLQLLGMLMGAFGLYSILRAQLNFESGDLSYAALVLVATLCYAISLTTIKFKLSNIPALGITALSFFLVLLPALVISLYTEAPQMVVAHPMGYSSLGFLVLLSVIGTAIAVFLFTKLVSISSPLFATGVTYLIPLVAIFIGVSAGENFELINLIWVVVILGGVYFMNKKSTKNQ